jgi:glutamate synthase (NADPH/NADH)
LEKYDAVVLATGATVGQDLSTTPGRELQGVHLAMEYLTKNTKALLDGGEVGQSWRQFAKTKGVIDTKGKSVVVIGGGDTATDCIGTAVRQGAKSVVNLIRKPRLSDKRGSDDCWPYWPNTFKVDYGHAEAAVAVNGGDDIRLHQVVTKEFVGNEKGILTGIKVVSVEYDERMKMTEVKGSERVIEADFIFLALGFSGPERSLAMMFGIDVDQRRNYDAPYKHEANDFRTSNPKVFATGDCRRGQSLVVWAIREGRDCAASIHKYLDDMPKFSPPERKTFKMVGEENAQQ